MPGFGHGIDLSGALIANTCKPSADDELFAVDHPSAGQLSMPAYDRCVEAASGSGAELCLKACSDELRQRFTLTTDSRIRLEDADGDTAYCLAIEPGTGQPTGGPSHLRRDLLLAPCEEVDASLSR